MAFVSTRMGSQYYALSDTQSPIKTMIPAQTKTQLTFEDYLRYDDGTDRRYELEDGELILMNPPTFRHAFIIRFLTMVFEDKIRQLTLPWMTLSGVGVRTSVNRSRIPDLCVINRSQVSEVDVSAVMASAILVVEIVSPESKTRDYRFKRSEYSVVGIAEYWIVDPVDQKIVVLNLVEGLYEETEYRGDLSIASEVFPELALTATQILKA